MYTRKCMSLHQRSIALLEMICEAKNRKARAEQFLRTFQVSGPWDIIRLVNSESKLQSNIDRCEKVRARLVEWYADVQIRLNKEVFARIEKESEQLKNVVTIAENKYKQSA